jgi:hypothetical protein
VKETASPEEVTGRPNYRARANALYNLGTRFVDNRRNKR